MRRLGAGLLGLVLAVLGWAVSESDPTSPVDEAAVVDILLRGARPADVLGGASTRRVASAPILSLWLPYTPETGQLSPAAFDKLRPLARALGAPRWRASRFVVVCCGGLGQHEAESDLRRRLARQIEHAFGGDERGSDQLQIRVTEAGSDEASSPTPGAGAAVVRVDLYPDRAPLN